MPRKEIGAPDENRKKAQRLIERYEEQIEENDDFSDYGCDETQQEQLDIEIKKNKKSATEYVMRLVSIKTYTESALRQKLKMRGYGLDETEQAIEYARKFGYINDLRLAQNAAEKLAAKPWGKKKIYAYLRQKGISSQTIDQIDLGQIDFKENACRLASKCASLGKTKEQTARALVSAGFSVCEISYAINVD